MDEVIFILAGHAVKCRGHIVGWNNSFSPFIASASLTLGPRIHSRTSLTFCTSRSQQFAHCELVVYNYYEYSSKRWNTVGNCNTVVSTCVSKGIYENAVKNITNKIRTKPSWRKVKGKSVMLEHKRGKGDSIVIYKEWRGKKHVHRWTLKTSVWWTEYCEHNWKLLKCCVEE